MSDIRDFIPALSIRPRAGVEHPALLLRDFEVLLDGVPLKGIQRLELSLASDEINRMTVDMSVLDIEVDPQFLVLLEAHVKERESAAA